jgi:hypothetical protein
VIQAPRSPHAATIRPKSSPRAAFSFLAFFLTLPAATDLAIARTV